MHLSTCPRPQDSLAHLDEGGGREKEGKRKRKRKEGKRKRKEGKRCTCPHVPVPKTLVNTPQRREEEEEGRKQRKKEEEER